MRKRAFILSGLVILFLSSCLTMSEMPQDARTISKIIEVNKNADLIFVESNLWLSETFKSAEAVIKYSDKEAGIIMGKGIYDKFVGIGTRRYSYSVKIEVKENKVRITFVALNVTADVGQGFSGGSPVVEATWKDLKPFLLKLQRDFENRIATGTSSDW